MARTGVAESLRQVVGESQRFLLSEGTVVTNACAWSQKVSNLWLKSDELDVERRKALLPGDAFRVKMVPPSRKNKPCGGGGGHIGVHVKKELVRPKVAFFDKRSCADTRLLSVDYQSFIWGALAEREIIWAQYNCTDSSAFQLYWRARGPRSIRAKAAARL